MISEILSPENYQLNIDGVLATTTATMILTLGVFTLIREWESPIRTSYFLFAFTFFLIFFSNIFLRIGLNLEVIEFWDAGAHIGLLLVPPVIISFSSVVLTQQEQKRNLIYICWLISLTFLLLLIFNNDFVSGHKRYPWGFEAEYGIVGAIFASYLLASGIYVLSMYWRTFKTSPPNSILWQRAKWLMTANIIGFFALVDLAPSFGIEIYPFGSVFIAILFIFMSVVTWRYKLLDIDAKFAAESIIKTMRDGLIVLDDKFEIKLINDAVAQHYKMIEIDTMQALLKDRLESLADESTLPDSVQDFDFAYLSDEEKTYYLSVSISLIKQDNKIISAYVCAFRDITEKKIAERELKNSHIELERRVDERTKKLAEEIESHIKTEKSLLIAKEEAEEATIAKGRFLANITHELRTPMHAILNFAKLGEKKFETASKEKIKTYFSYIANSGDRLLILVNDLLDLSKLDSGNMSLIIKKENLTEITQACIKEQEILLEKKNLHCDVNIENYALTVNCDYNRMTQVITNLLSNAIKYSPENSEITIFIKAEDIMFDNEKINRSAKPCISFSIANPGIGIPIAELKKIFYPFVQSSKTDSGAGGTGLGLSICREIIQLHHGNIYAENTDEGVKFNFYIPLLQTVV